jgi:prepilin-type processing-associated H-X9-DG protein
LSCPAGGSLRELANKHRDVWHCSTDRSGLVRSISMNCWLNCDETADQFFGLPSAYRLIRRTTVMGLRGSKTVLVNYPASYHNQAGNLVFADGHTETHRWREPLTNPPMRRGVYLGMPQRPSPNNVDVEWLQDHTTGLK